MESRMHYNHPSVVLDMLDFMSLKLFYKRAYGLSRTELGKISHSR